MAVIGAPKGFWTQHDCGRGVGLARFASSSAAASVGKLSP
jgi:hypothetical protein